MGGYDTKRLLRETVRTVRCALPRERAAKASAAVCARLAGAPVLTAIKRLVAYCATDGEVDPSGLVEAARAAHVPVYFPAIRRSALTFVEPDGPLRPGRYGIPEPASGRELGDAGPETLILVPGVAFDLDGLRLGRGGGHYDRALAKRPGVTSIGLAFEFQVIPRLPRDAWDVPVWAIATEDRLIGGRT